MIVTDENPKSEHPTGEQKYRSILQGALQRANAAAEIQIESKKPGVEFSITVTPRNPRAARVILEVVETNVIFLHLGQATTFEFPKWGGAGAGGESESEQIGRFTKAVAEGRFEEDLFYRDAKLVAGRGVIHFLDRDVPIKWRRMGLALFKRKIKRHVTYEPYS